MALFLGLEVLLLFHLWEPAFGQYSGPDPHMRMARVLECLGGPGCPGGLLLRSNVPYGEVLHWPFLMDWLLLVLAAPLAPFAGLHDAVLTAGYLLGPLLGVAALWGATAAARPILGDRARMALAPLLALHFWVLLAFAPVRPDHHGLQLLIFAGVLGGTLRLMTAADRGAALATGIASGLAVWVSTEGLISTAPLLLAPAALWVFRGGERLARLNGLIFVAAALVLAVGLAVDGPQPDRWAIEFDRFSGVHVVAFALVAFFWWGVASAPRLTAGPIHRLAAGALGLAVVVLGLVLLFPGIQRGPMADVHPALFTLWLSQVSEFMPLMEDARGTWLWAGLAPGAAGLAVSLVAARRAAVAHRAAWWALAGSLTWFGALALTQQVRWTHYVHFLAPFPMAWLMQTAWTAAPAAPTLRRAALQTASVLAIGAWPVLTLAVPAAAGALDPGVDARQVGCSPARVAEALARLPRTPGERRPRVLAQVFWGPELMLRGDVDVVHGPYHRNDEGMLYAHAVMESRNPDEARLLLRERGIDYVAVCSTEDFVPLVDRTDPETFYGRLTRGDPPPWLETRPLPDLPEQYLLYAVER